MLRSMGVLVTSTRQGTNGHTQYETRLTPPRPLVLSPFSLSLPGDFSSAAFLIVGALITPGSAITIQEVGLNPGRTGLLDALLSMGADICITGQCTRQGEPVGNLVVRHSQLHSTRVNGEQVVRMIDEFPIFAVAAAFAEGATEVSDALELRNKESDRISDLCQELRTLGVQADESPDGFTIQGGAPLQGGTTSPHGDHRLAMSLAVAGCAAQAPVAIQQAEIISESYPEFVPTLQGLGAHFEEER
jgi:3-phosphoshikimate 1-carboxyvinyltransferase